MGNGLNDLMVATCPKAVGASSCSGLLAGLDCAAHRDWKSCAVAEPSSGTAQIAVFQVTGLASTRSIPRTSVGNIDANVTASAPPKECPTTTYGACSPADCSSPWRSPACVAKVCGTGAASLVPLPKRS